MELTGVRITWVFSQDQIGVFQGLAVEVDGQIANRFKAGWIELNHLGGVVTSAGDVPPRDVGTGRCWRQLYDVSPLYLDHLPRLNAVTPDEISDFSVR